MRCGVWRARLGLRLLTRTTRSVAPTEAGERLLETLRPALDDIDLKLAALTELRERPAGTVRITTSIHAARTVLWPVVDRLTSEHPDIHIELSVDAGFVDIVSERFDAGVRLGESLEKDMIAVRIGPRLRMAAVGSPAYFARRGTPRRLMILPSTPASISGWRPQAAYMPGSSTKMVANCR